MPLDVLGRTRATLTEPASFFPWPEGLGNLVKLCRAGDRALQLLLFNEECLVGTSHQLVPITSLPFVHTARRYYRLNGLVSLWDWQLVPATVAGSRKLRQTWSFRGSKSRNKVSVGEPAEGSLVKIWAGHTDAKKCPWPPTPTIHPQTRVHCLGERLQRSFLWPLLGSFFATNSNG